MHDAFDGGGHEAPRPAVRRVLRRPLPASPGGDGEEAEGGRLLRPAASCPRCGARPAMRVTAAMVRALAGEDAGTRLATYQCQRRGCGAIYDLSVGACVRAG